MQNATRKAGLILPPTGLNQPGVITFRGGNATGAPEVKIGTVTMEPVPGEDGTGAIDVTGFNEIGSVAVTKAVGFTSYTVRLNEGTGSSRLAFKFIGDTGDWMEIDQVAIIEENPGVKVAFRITDQNDEPLDKSEVLFNNMPLYVNAYGYCTYRDTDPGSYAYSVTYKGNEIASGILEVDGEVIKHIKHNTSGISGPEDLLPVSIMPNPVSDRFVVTGIQEGTLSILNFSGQLLLQQTVRNGEAVPAGALQKGLYLVKISSGGATVYRKVLKN